MKFWKYFKVHNDDKVQLRGTAVQKENFRFQSIYNNSRKLEINYFSTLYEELRKKQQFKPKVNLRQK